MSDDSRAAPPSAAVIRKTREKAGLKMAEAAALVHTYERLWRYWEAGTYRMPPAAWELFLIKLEQRNGGDA